MQNRPVSKKGVDLDLRITVDWWNSTSISDGYLLLILDELNQQLEQEYSQLPRFIFQEIQPDLASHVPDYLLSQMPGRHSEDKFPELEDRYLFILCDPTTDFAVAYQEHNDLAHWGVAIPSRFSIAWVPYKYLIWHELLHLMNAKDCYNKFGINKCQNPQCIMRRAPSRQNCGDRLTMCSKNEKRIQQFGLAYSAMAEHR